jgi:LmbE family N-acetylglucosaminyl deacetylase
MNPSAFVDAVTAARIVDPQALTFAGGVLLLVPHPDDESLGCGQAIAALIDTGLRVQAVQITDGSRSHPHSSLWPAARLAALRAQEFRRAWRHRTGARQPEPAMLRYRDCDAPGDPQRRQMACNTIGRLISHQTGAIWAPWSGDPHVDHARTAALAAQMYARHPRLHRHAYPIWARFDPQRRVPAAQDMALGTVPHLQRRKTQALAAHASQMTGLIFDDPTGFVMRDDHQQHFLDHPEIFIRETYHAE